jgi:hypothetical protein
VRCYQFYLISARRCPQIRTGRGQWQADSRLWFSPLYHLFSGQNFEFDFLLVAVATTLLGMDFLAKFDLSIIPSKQQVLHAASGCTFSKAT